jgi:hypothetical protein
MDAAAVRTPCTLPNQVCCKLRTSKKLRHAPDGEIGRFCSAVSLILAATKLQDDIRDGGSLKARLFYWLLQKRVRAATRYLTAIDAKFDERINEFIRRHLEMEKTAASVGLEEYSKPTSEAFAYTFGLMAHVSDVMLDKETLEELGRRVGAALIAFDCAFDWHCDKANGEFNPLPDKASIHAAIGFCQDQLVNAAQVCRRAFGSECQTSKVLLAVKENIVHAEPRTIYTNLRELFQQWGFIRQKGVVQLNSDCWTCLGIGCFCICCATVCTKRDNEVHVYHHKGCD